MELPSDPDGRQVEEGGAVWAVGGERGGCDGAAEGLPAAVGGAYDAVAEVEAGDAAGVELLAECQDWVLLRRVFGEMGSL